MGIISRQNSLRIFFDDSVFFEGGGADTSQLTARERGFEHVTGIHGALAAAGVDEGMEFVDEEDDLSFAGGDFL